MDNTNINQFRVYRPGIYPQKKKVFFDNTFSTRQKARVFCRNRKYFYSKLVIVHPNLIEEEYLIER